MINSEKILPKVKNALGITGEYQDDTLRVYIEEVESYMLSAGVPYEVVLSSVAVGTIARGVSDLWNYNSGNLSPYFKERVIQLTYEGGGKCV